MTSTLALAPSTFGTEVWVPKPYQLEALEFSLSRSYAGLMLDPGLGKTSTTLAAFQILQKAGQVRRCLVVAPIYVAENVWPVEALKWKDFEYMWVENISDMSDSRMGKILRNLNVDIVVINPESLIKVLLHPQFDQFQLDMLVVDESTKFKESQTQRFKELRKHLFKFKRRYILTGTPAPEGLQDLFSQIFILDRGDSLGEYITHFRKAYMFQSDESRHKWIMKPGQGPTIYGLVKDLLLRMKAKDHLAMPELVPNFIEVDLPDEIMVKYKELDRDFITEVHGEKVVTPQAGAKGVKLRQFASGFVYINLENEPRRTVRLHDAKLRALRELVEEMQGRPLLLAYEFNEDCRAIMAQHPEAKMVSEPGAIAAFNSGTLPILLIHPKSGGYGLNLQGACNTLCWFTTTWSLEAYIQLIARLWRQGQVEPTVVVHHIIARRTRDIKVKKAIEAKASDQNELDLYLVDPL